NGACCCSAAKRFCFVWEWREVGFLYQDKRTYNINEESFLFILFLCLSKEKEAKRKDTFCE
ncbi:MAG: hypothetical protein D6707_01310, partial [Bacteroidetes bacterium]